MYLTDLAVTAQVCRESGSGFPAFNSSEVVRGLRWPADVTEQWLYDHADNVRFSCDYGAVELSQVRWSLETFETDVLAQMQTGASDRGVLEEVELHSDHCMRVRNVGVHVGVAQMWDVHGTWKRWPVLIDRELLDPPNNGVQIVEGRTRIGILRGRLKQRKFVADHHLVWVGRPTDVGVT